QQLRRADHVRPPAVAPDLGDDCDAVAACVREAPAPALGARVSRRALDLILLLLLLIGVWEGLHRLVGEEALSSPRTTVLFLWAYLGDPAFHLNGTATLVALGYAVAIAVVGGLLVGLPLGFYRAAGDVADPYLMALFAIPKITLY